MNIIDQGIEDTYHGLLFLYFLIMCFKSGLEHSGVAAEHVGLGNFSF